MNKNNYYFLSTYYAYRVGSITPILQMSTLRLKEVR